MKINIILLCTISFILFSSLVTFGQYDSVPVEITAVKANIREDPYNSAKVVGTVTKGQTVFASAYYNGWYYVKNKTLRGWLHQSTINDWQKPPDFVSGCKTPLPLPAFADKGFDTVVVTDSSASVWNILPDKSWERHLLVPNQEFTFLDLDKDRSLIRVFDDRTKQTGYIGCPYAQIYNSAKKKNQVQDLPDLSKTAIEQKPKPRTTEILDPQGDTTFKEEYIGGNQTEVFIKNDTSRIITLQFGGATYNISPNFTQVIYIDQGTYDFSVSAPGVRSLSGSRGFRSGHKYTWTFFIVTRRV